MTLIICFPQLNSAYYCSCTQWGLPDKRKELPVDNKAGEFCIDGLVKKQNIFFISNYNAQLKQIGRDDW